MNWGDLAGTLAQIGLPTLGGAIGGPIGSAIGKTIADALGTQPTPKAVNDALQADPTGAASTLHLVEIEWAKTIAQLGTKQVEEVAETIRAELTQGAWYQRAWRPFIAGVWGLSLLPQMAVVLYVAVKVSVADAAALANALFAWNGVPGGVVGVYAWRRSTEKAAMATGELPETVLGQIINAITRRKK